MWAIGIGFLIVWIVVLWGISRMKYRLRSGDLVVLERQLQTGWGGGITQRIATQVASVDDVGVRLTPYNHNDADTGDYCVDWSAVAWHGRTARWS